MLILCSILKNVDFILMLKFGDGLLTIAWNGNDADTVIFTGLLESQLEAGNHMHTSAPSAQLTE